MASEEVLERKVERALALRHDGDDLRHALESLDGFVSGNDDGLVVGQTLRSDLEWQSLSVCQRFLEDFEKVALEFERAQESVHRVVAGCESMRERMDRTERETEAFVTMVKKIEAERRDVAAQKAEAERLLAAFVLSEQEELALDTAALDGPDGGAAFFAALERVEQVQDAYRARGTPAGQAAAPVTVAPDVLEAAQRRQDAAMDRLFRWVIENAGRFDQGDAGNDAGETAAAGRRGAALARAVARLRRRPALLRHARASVVSARRAALVRRFVRALTRPGPGGFPRAIEDHAHEPLRYVRDMLGWVHLALASEQDAVEVLFGDPAAVARGSDGTAEGAAEGAADASASSGAEDEAAAQRATVDAIVAGACGPLSVRVKQVLAARPPLSLAFRLRALLRLYRWQLTRAARPDGALEAALAALVEAAEDAFSAALEAEAEALRRSALTVPSGLSPPHIVSAVVERVGEVLASQAEAAETQADKTAAAAAAAAAASGEASAPPSQPAQPAEQSVADAGEAARAKAEARHVVDTLFEPLLEATAAAAGTLPPRDAAVLRANTAHAMRRVLAPHPVAAAWAQRLALEADAAVDDAIAAAAEDCVRRLGVAEVAAAVRGGEPGTAATRLVTLGPARVATALRTMHTALFAMEVPAFDEVRASSLRVRARTAVASAVADTYAAIYDAVRAGGSDLAAAAEALQHTPDQVRVLVDAE